jgi:hypothetical protein
MFQLVSVIIRQFVQILKNKGKLLLFVKSLKYYEIYITKEL